MMRAKITDRFIKERILNGSALPRQIFPPQIDVEIRDTSLSGFVLIVRKSSVLSFCLRYRNENCQARKFTIGRYGAITTTKAREIAQRKLAEVRTGIDVQSQRVSARREAQRARLRTLRGFIDKRYGEWLRAERKSAEATLARIKANFGDWYDRPLMDINIWLVTNWRAKKLKTGSHRATVNRDIGALKALMSKAVEWEVVAQHPLGELKPVKEDKGGLTRFLNDNEESRLRKALDTRQDKQRAQRRAYITWQRERGRDLLPSLDYVTFTDYLKPIVLITLNTGLRRGELFNLRRHDIGLARRTLIVRGDGAKSGQTRFIPLNQEAYDVLRQWLEQRDKKEQDLIFPSPVTGRRLVTIKTAWLELMKLSRIEGFRFHDLRHTFASKLVMKGADLYTVKELLGHSSIETTQRYAHLTPEHKLKAVELL
ncbi:MAG: tyrosine-type recombinase/integrase [Planctomycetota bacterium]|jgi:site-specific recombinase XerD